MSISALGVVAATGLVATVSGIIALQQGQLGLSLLPTGPAWSSTASPGSVAVQSASTVVLFCLAAVCLLAVTPATSVGAGRRARWAIWLSVGTAITCWGFAVPGLTRSAGLDFSGGLLTGNSDAVRSALAATLTPLAGSDAPTMAGWLLFVACLAAALGALTGGTELAQSALATAKLAGANTTRSSRQLSAASCGSST